MPTWLLTIIVGVVIAVAGKLAEKAMNKDAALWVWQTFGVELWPMWLGVIGAVLFLFIRFLYRLHSDARWKQFRDERKAEFDGWLGDREREFRERYDQNFRDREAEAKAIAATNIAGLQTFADGITRRLDAIEARLPEKP
jgi:hypothetical protein